MKKILVAALLCSATVVYAGKPMVSIVMPCIIKADNKSTDWGVVIDTLNIEKLYSGSSISDGIYMAPKQWSLRRLEIHQIGAPMLVVHPKGTWCIWYDWKDISLYYSTFEEWSEIRHDSHPRPKAAAKVLALRDVAPDQQNAVTFASLGEKDGVLLHTESKDLLRAGWTKLTLSLDEQGHPHLKAGSPATSR